MIKVGDYVTTYSSGYFRVEKIIDRYAQTSDKDHLKGEKISSIVISKQVFNQTYDFNLGFDRSEEADVKKASDKALNVINEFFENHPDKLKMLNEYEIPDIRKNKNIMLTLTDEELEKLTIMLYSIKHKFTLNELKNAFIKNSLQDCIGNKGGNTYMLCIVNVNYECNSKHEEVYLFDKVKTLKGKK